MTEPVFLRDEYTGDLVRDPLGTPIVIGQTPIRPPLSYMPTPPMSYASTFPPPPLYPTPTPVITPVIPPPVYRQSSSYGYNYPYYGTGCCEGGLAGIGCCICCDSCCRDYGGCCRGCCDCCYDCYW